MVLFAGVSDESWCVFGKRSGEFWGCASGEGAAAGARRTEFVFWLAGPCARAAKRVLQAELQACLVTREEAEIMDADHLGEAMEEAGNLAAKWRRQSNSILPRADGGEPPRGPADEVYGEVSTAPAPSRYVTSCQREMSHAAECEMLDVALDAPEASPAKKPKGTRAQ